MQTIIAIVVAHPKRGHRIDLLLGYSTYMHITHVYGSGNRLTISLFSAKKSCIPHWTQHLIKNSLRIQVLKSLVSRLDKEKLLFLPPMAGLDFGQYEAIL